jgi:hypothetical protein
MSKHGKKHHDKECECKEKFEKSSCDCGEECNCGGQCHGECDEGCNCDGQCNRGGCHDTTCCCGGHHFERRFRTKAEQIAELEAYLAELKLEVQAVEEILAELRK